MKRSFGFVAVILISVILLCASAYGRDPIKWSAPMNEYPNSWYPTPAPPSYYNSYGYQYPYAGYGYGGYYGGQYQGAYQQPQQRGYTGNPYNYNYYYGQ
jgi:hypothetical protein